MGLRVSSDPNLDTGNLECDSLERDTAHLLPSNEETGEVHILTFLPFHAFLILHFSQTRREKIPS